MLHPLLKKQLKELGLGDPTQVPSEKHWIQLLTQISQTYREHDRGRPPHEGSLGLSSNEMQQLYEDLRQSSEAQLKGMEAQTQSLISHSLDGIVKVTSEGEILIWNPSAEDIFGWALEELRGKNFGETLFPHRFQNFLNQELQQLAQTRSETKVSQRFELVALHKGGWEFPIELSIISVFDEGLPYFYGVIRDLTQRKLADKALSEAKEAAEKTVKAKSAFLATVSHELRTPMNGIIGMTGLLMETPLTSQQKQFAETVRISSEALLTIVNDLLDYSKIEAGKLDLEVIDFDLRVTIEDTIDLLAEKAGSKGLELVGCVSANVPTALQGDPGRFRQVLLNLVGNAIKFTPSGDVTVFVSLLKEDSDFATIKIDVKDTGIGIDLKTQSHLFHPFTQADSSTNRKYGGTGLGLAICKQIVDLMGGSISVVSEPQKGSLFTFTSQFKKQIHPLTPSSSRRELQGLKICCIDDHSVNRELLERYTTEWGMDVQLAETPAAALILIQQAHQIGKPFDLAILDMAMPGMNGARLAQVLKSDPRFSDIRLVLLTSLGHRGEAQEAQSVGFSGYLTKPIRKGVLQQTLATVMGLREATLESPSPPLVTRFSAIESFSTQKGRILVVDDQQVNQQLAVLMLERLGYSCDVASNGKEAIQAVQKVSYSLILMDCQMPEMDGYQATKEIRHLVKGIQTESPTGESNSSHHLPIIAMTANALPEDREKCLVAGMDDYLTKPIRPGELQETLLKWLPPDQFSKMSSSHSIPAEDISRVSQGSQPHSRPLPFDAEKIVQWQTLGGPTVFDHMVKQFVYEALECVNQLETALETQDPTHLVHAAHGLKGICQYMGASNLAYIAGAIEQDCMTHIPSHIPDQVATLRKAIDTIPLQLQHPNDE